MTHDERNEKRLYIGGVLIRRFDGFRRLCRHAADEFHLPLQIPDQDMLLANRTLAGLGGPPASSQVEGTFQGDGLPLLLLFLLTQEYACRIGLAGEADPVLARVKALTHLLGHAVWPTMTGSPEPLAFQEVVRELGPSSTQLRPLFQYDQEGEPTAMERLGAESLVRVGADGGPYHLAVMLGNRAAPMPLVMPGDSLHPTVLWLKN